MQNKKELHIVNDTFHPEIDKAKKLINQSFKALSSFYQEADDLESAKEAALEINGTRIGATVLLTIADAYLSKNDLNNATLILDSISNCPQDEIFHFMEKIKNHHEFISCLSKKTSDFIKISAANFYLKNQQIDLLSKITPMINDSWHKDSYCSEIIDYYLKHKMVQEAKNIPWEVDKQKLRIFDHI